MNEVLHQRESIFFPSAPSPLARLSCSRSQSLIFTCPFSFYCYLLFFLSFLTSSCLTDGRQSIREAAAATCGGPGVQEKGGPAVTHDAARGGTTEGNPPEPGPHQTAAEPDTTGTLLLLLIILLLIVVRFRERSSPASSSPSQSGESWPTSEARACEQQQQEEEEEARYRSRVRCERRGGKEKASKRRRSNDGEEEEGEGKEPES